MARAVYYGHRGRISAHEVYDQMNACSCLTLTRPEIYYGEIKIAPAKLIRRDP